MIKRPYFYVNQETSDKWGRNASIHFISGNTALKIPRPHSPSMSREHLIQSKIAEYGFSDSVPEIHSIEKVLLPTGKLIKGIFMERIYGSTLQELEQKGENIFSLMKEAKRTASDIYKKTGARPLLYYGMKKRNIMLDELRDRVVLIDFGNWKLPRSFSD